MVEYDADQDYISVVWLLLMTRSVGSKKQLPIFMILLRVSFLETQMSNIAKILTSLEVEYLVAILLFCAIEAVYQESFAHCLEDGNKIPQELQKTCERWGNEGFGSYCKMLRDIVDRCLRKASPDAILKA
nr:probable bifunctional TENA-E protein [Tanacetum cinerariifolium]